MSATSSNATAATGRQPAESPENDNVEMALLGSKKEAVDTPLEVTTTNVRGVLCTKL